MRTFAQKLKATQRPKSANSAIPVRSHNRQNRKIIPIHQLQRTIGNQAIQRLLQAEADDLNAHELTHVVQQTGNNQSKIIQTSPDTEKSNGGNTGNETTAFTKIAADVIEKAGGKVKFHYFAADREWNSSFIMFDDFYVHKLYRYLFKRWFGDAEVEDLENTEDLAAPPKWVGEFRAKALNVRPKKPGDKDYNAYLEEKQLADLAVKLADSVAPETPAQKVRRQFVEEAGKRVGTTVMTQEQINAERKKEASGEYTPGNFTTCIEFFSQVAGKVMRQSGTERPLLHGPNHYKEINPQAKASLPSGAWHECRPKTRPKPGDLLIFTFASDVYKPSGELKYGKGWFAHISILRSIEPIRDISSDKEAKAFAKRCKGANGNIEKWISVDGGGTTAKEVTRYFCPDTCLIKQGSIIRTVKGWIDVEKVAEAELSGKSGVR